MFPPRHRQPQWWRTLLSVLLLFLTPKVPPSTRSFQSSQKTTRMAMIDENVHPQQLPRLDLHPPRSSLLRLPPCSWCRRSSLLSHHCRTTTMCFTITDHRILLHHFRLVRDVHLHILQNPGSMREYDVSGSSASVHPTCTLMAWVPSQRNNILRSTIRHLCKIAATVMKTFCVDPLPSRDRPKSYPHKTWTSTLNPARRDVSFSDYTLSNSATQILITFWFLSLLYPGSPNLIVILDDVMPIEYSSLTPKSLLLTNPSLQHALILNLPLSTLFSTHYLINSNPLQLPKEFVPRENGAFPTE